MDSTKQNDVRMIKALLVLSLWAARISIVAAVVHLVAYSIWFQNTSFFQDMGDIISGIQDVIHGVSLGAIPVIHYLTVQTLLRSQPRKNPNSPPSRKRFIWAIVDRVFVLGTAGTSIFFAYTWDWPEFSMTWVPATVVISAMGLMIQGVFLACLSVLRIIIMIRTKGRCLFAPFYEDERGIYTEDGELHRHSRKSFITVGSNVLGGGLHGLIGEHWIIICLRATASIFFVYTLITYAFNSLIVGPQQESDSLGMKASRYYGTSKEEIHSQFGITWAPDSVWGISVKLADTQANGLELRNAINFTSRHNSSTTTELCAIESQISDEITFMCYSNSVIITIDFNQIPASSDFPAAYVFIGFSRDSGIIHSAMPIPLISGSHLYAHVALEVRKRFDFRLADFLGLTLPGTSHAGGRIVGLVPDPSSPNNSAQSSDIASLRLKRVDAAILGYVDSISDYQENTIAKGLSAVGGLATVFSSIFVFLFGGGMLFQLIGSRPLGVFGLVHIFQQNRLSEINSIPRAESPVGQFLGRFLIELRPARSEETQVLPVNSHDGACRKCGCCCQGNNDQIKIEKGNDAEIAEGAGRGEEFAYSHPKDRNVTVGILEVEAAGRSTSDLIPLNTYTRNRRMMSEEEEIGMSLPR